MWKCINCEHSASSYFEGTMTDHLELPRSGLAISINYCSNCAEFQTFNIHGCIDDKMVKGKGRVGLDSFCAELDEQKVRINCSQGHGAEFKFGYDTNIDYSIVSLECSGGKNGCEAPLDSRFCQIVPHCGKRLNPIFPIDPKAPGHPAVKELYEKLKKELID